MNDQVALQEELLRQRERLSADFPSRHLGVILTCAVIAFYLHPALVALVYVASGVTDYIQHRQMHRVTIAPSRILHASILAVTTLGMAVFSLPALVLWTFDDTMVRFAGILTLVGALLNVSVIRATHLPLGLLNGLPPALVLLWLPTQQMLYGPDSRTAPIAVAAVLALLAYFVSALIQNHRTQTRLAEATKQANAANEAKTRFLSAVSHEMRTPLNTLLGLSQTLQTGAADPAAASQAHAMEAAARRLDILVEDVLVYTEAEEAVAPRRAITVDLRREIAAALALAAPGQTACEFAPAVPTLGRIDPARLSRCLHYVASCLGDAATGQGLRLACHLHPDIAGQLRIDITPDPAAQGEGPDPGHDNLAALLAQRLAGDLGATLTFLAGPAGMSARLDVPVDPAPALPLPDTSPGATPRRALVVDDIATNRFVVVRLLRSLGIAAEEADGGRSALEKLSADHFDVVLLDMNMPGLDGAATFHAIRATGGAWAKVPVIAMTTDAFDNQRDRALALGMNGYVPKPIDLHHLWAEIEGALAAADGR